MGGEKGDDKGLVKIPSPAFKADHRDDGDTWGGRGVETPPGGRSNVHQGTSPHRILHKEATGDHTGKGGLPPHI